MTVEAAIALGVLVVVALAAMGAVLAVVAAVRCTDAAREAARLAARGEPDRGRVVAAQLAPPGAVVEIGTRGDDVVVSVTAFAVRPFPFRVSGRAVAATEPGGPDPAAGVAAATGLLALRRCRVRRRAAATRAGGSDDAGVATVYAALAAVLVLGLAVVGIDLGGAVLARHRAEAAADLAALAAATDAALGQDAACARARTIAAGMGSTLRHCALDGWDALVEVGTPRAAVFGDSEALGRARAGPVEPP
ncbi:MULTISPECIES: Rv3654c family TadE-like protein [unclassified Pseudonocardia]|uniref:Rv3654c family TadE-like protein n=1 Tax=unclassified Pseudonocardia TaxID=2619320 RepID=UPI000AD46BFD|nr:MULTISPECIES: Rv3654c family TadE-like protein [unclassified Pseudonocardia]